jgi:hypothetical protein
MVDVLEKRFNQLAEQIVELQKMARLEYNNFTHTTDLQIDSNDLLNWSVKVRNLLSKVCESGSPYINQFEIANEPLSYETNLSRLKRIKAIFFAAKEDFEGGYLVSVKNLIQGEVFETELEQAKELQSAGYKTAAAVIAGVVLETSIRNLCTQHNIQHGSLNKMNADLAKAGVVNKLRQKRITALADIRNSAAHGKPDEFTTADVEMMINEIEAMVSDMLS